MLDRCGDTEHRKVTAATTALVTVLAAVPVTLRAPSRRRVYLVFPLLILWGNLHGSASLGAGLVVLYGVSLLAEDLRAGRSWRVRGRSLALTIGAPLVRVLVADPVEISASYADKLQDASLEAELTGEVLKLAFIRASKGRRFRYALWATGGFYLLVFVSFLLLQRCT